METMKSFSSIKESGNRKDRTSAKVLAVFGFQLCHGLFRKEFLPLGLDHLTESLPVSVGDGPGDDLAFAVWVHGYFRKW